MSLGISKTYAKLPWTSFGRYLMKLPLEDSFGRLSLQEKKTMAAAAESWHLMYLHPLTLSPTDVITHTQFPVIVGVDGDTIDGRRRLSDSCAKGEQSILCWVGSDISVDRPWCEESSLTEVLAGSVLKQLLNSINLDVNSATASDPIQSMGV